MNWWVIITVCIIGIIFITLILGFISWLLSSPWFWIVVGIVLLSALGSLSGGGGGGRSIPRHRAGSGKVDWNDVRADISSSLD